MPKAPDTADIAGVIARCPWFTDLPDTARQQLAHAAHFRNYSVNDFVFTSGEQTTELYCVVSGRLRYSITSTQGHCFALTDMEPEYWLGEAVLAGDDARVLEAQAREKTTLLVLPRSIVLTVGEQFPQMYRSFFLEEARRNRQLSELIGGMMLYPLHGRLAGRFLIMAHEVGKETAEGVEVTVKLSQSDLALLSLGSRQRINKILQEWSRRDIVVARTDGYLIKDIEALRDETELAET